MTAIKRLRKRQGITQQELAQRVGVKRTSVVKWETQGVCPRVQMLPVLARALGCSIDDLFEADLERKEDS